MNDMHSAMNPDRQYGRAGDPVKVLSDNGGVLIVESKITGVRFPALYTEIADRVEEKKETVITPPPILRGSKAKRTKAIPVAANTLF